MYPLPEARTGSIVRFLSNDEILLALETRGSGPRRLLFAHGWISSRRMFYEVCNRLDPAEYTMQLLDFRGAGLSDRPGTGYDLEGYASDLRIAINAAGGPVEVVAHSMGGRVAQYVALDPPENLARLTLIAPGTAKAAAMNGRHRALAQAAFGSRLEIERFQRAAMVREIAPDAMERLVEDALTISHDAWFGWYDYGRLHDFSDRLANIHIPTVVIAGNRDQLAQVARLRRDVVAAINGAVMIELRNVGHNIPVETPAEVAAIIDRLGIERARAI